MKNLLPLIASTFCVTQIASAHPTGHTESIIDTVRHVVSQPDHFIAIVLFAAVSGFAIKKLISSRKQAKCKSE